MITNGGYGGVQHALGYGVPLIVAGETSDKAEVAARVEYAGVGVDLKTAAPGVGAINAAVRDVTTRRTYQSAAERLARAIRQTRPLDDIAAIVEDVAVPNRSASEQRLS